MLGQWLYFGQVFGRRQVPEPVNTLSQDQATNGFLLSSRCQFQGDICRTQKLRRTCW